MKVKKRKNAIKDTTSDRILYAVNTILLTVLTIIILYPLYFTIIASFSDPIDTVRGKALIFVSGFTTEAYKAVLGHQDIWVGYGNTLKYVFFGTLWSMFLTVPCAYALSKDNLPFNKILTWFFMFIMYFGGGMIATFLVIRDLGLYNKSYTLIFLSGFSTYNMIVCRTYFKTSIPQDLYDAAYLDGCGEISCMVRIALPLAKPILATIALFIAVSRWNSFFAALLYVKDTKLYPLALVLRNLLFTNQNVALDGLTDAEMEMQLRKQLMAESMKYSMIFISSAPVIIAYLFVQKYFVKGVMLGAVKG